jgi:mono/diheme cytochrome c family protein
MVRRHTRNTLLLCALLFSLAGFSATAQAQNKKSTHLEGSDPVSGLQLYKRYCAVCHGNDLKGNGPVSPEFKNPPSDLTTLAQRHEGKFPSDYVQDVLRNGVKKPAHGDTEMPGTDSALVSIRIVNLTNYIKSMQAK